MENTNEIPSSENMSQAQNITKNISSDNDKALNRLHNLQILIKKEACLKELCKQIYNN